MCGSQYLSGKIIGQKEGKGRTKRYGRKPGMTVAAPAFKKLIFNCSHKFSPVKMKRKGTKTMD